MRKRPLGITVLSVLLWVNVPWLGLLLALSLADRGALGDVLSALSPGGSGPAKAHLAAGALLPFYYGASLAISVAMARALWRLRNWARLVVLAMTAFSLLGLLASAGRLPGADAGAWALFVTRVGLCLCVGGYLVSARVRAAFARKGEPARPGAYRLFDALLPGTGIALVALGATVWPLGWPLGSTALALAFFGWVAEWNGIALPRPGRAALRTCGCWETPLAFSVRHRGSVLLFSREDDGEKGGWSESYTVHARAGAADAGPHWELPFLAAEGWSPRGRVPAGALRFEHHERVTYVDRGSLERALASATA